MPDDRYANPGWQWGTYGPGVVPGPIVIPVSVPEAQQLVDQGWTLHGELPGASTDTIEPPVPITPNVPPVSDTDVDAVRGAGPPTGITEPGPPTGITEPGPPPSGGPEDRPPPVDFDVPPTLAPGQPPALQPPAPGPIEGEYIPRERPGPVIFDDEGFPDFGYDREGPYRRRQIDVDLDRIVEGAVIRGIGRIVLGPLGSALPSILEPEPLGSGELPFPPIPKVVIPEPEPVVRYPGLPPAAEPPAPEIPRPDVPDVITVTPEDAWPNVPGPSATAPTSPAPTPVGLPNWAKIIGAILIGRALRRVPRPIYGGLEAPTSPISNEFPIPNPLPRDPLTPPLPTPGTDPLTPVDPTLLTSPTPLASGFGAPLMPAAQDTEQDRCRCKKCKEPKKRKKNPSSVIAHLKPFSRVMSKNSLRNLRRG